MTPNFMIQICCALKYQGTADFPQRLVLFVSLRLCGLARKSFTQRRKAAKDRKAGAGKLARITDSPFNLHAKVFDDRVRQNLARHARGFLPRIVFGQSAVEGDLEIFSLANVADALVTEQFNRMLNRLALRIEDAGF